MKINRKDAIQCVVDEPELPGEMPEGMWQILQKADKEMMSEAFRIMLQVSKEAIIKRLEEVETV